MLKRIPRPIQIAAAAVAAVIVIYFIPPVHDRLAWRIVDARLQVRNFFH